MDRFDSIAVCSIRISISLAINQHRPLALGLEVNWFYLGDIEQPIEGLWRDIGHPISYFFSSEALVKVTIALGYSGGSAENVRPVEDVRLEKRRGLAMSHSIFTYR